MAANDTSARTPPTDHAGAEVLPERECLELAASVPVGRIAFVSDGEVVVFPVNHVVDGRDIVFRTGMGRKYWAGDYRKNATFEVDDWDPQQKSGWSVMLMGRLEVIDRTEDLELERLGALGIQPWADGEPKDEFLRLVPAEITGRRI